MRRCAPGLTDRTERADSVRLNARQALLLEPSEDPIPRTSVVNLDSVESVSLGTLVERLGRLSDDRMRQICRALEIAIACEA